MKKIFRLLSIALVALVFTACAVLALTFASCGTTKGTVKALNAATGTSAPEADAGQKK